MADQGRAQFCVVLVGLAEGTRTCQEVSAPYACPCVSRFIVIYSTTRQRNSTSDEDELARQRVLNGQPHYPRANAGRAAPRRPNSPRTSGLSYEGTGSNGENRRDGPPPSRLYARSAHPTLEEEMSLTSYPGCRSLHPSSHWRGSWRHMSSNTRPSTLVAPLRHMFGGSRSASYVPSTS